MQADQEHRQSVDQSRGRVGAQALAVEGAVGERELQMSGDQAGVQRPALLIDAPLDHGERLDARHTQPLEIAQHMELAQRELGLDLLDRYDTTGEFDEAHDVPGDTARQRGESIGRPVLQRGLPGQVQ